MGENIFIPGVFAKQNNCTVNTVRQIFRYEHNARFSCVFCIKNVTKPFEI